MTFILTLYAITAVVVTLTLALALCKMAKDN